MQPSDSSHRILVVDDNPSIHGDFRKILCPRTSQTGTALASLAADIFDEAPEVRHLSGFEMESAYQGQEALSRIKQAHTDGRPYSMAFVDVRMPPGWDGVETISQIWKNHPDLQVVICTAYSDYSWEQIMHKLGETDSLVILRKPFDNVEVLQLAHTLTTKWEVTRRAHSRMADLDQRVEQRTRELQASNLALQQEIQRRSLIEATLRESEERFHQAFESVPVALGIWSPRIGYLDVNPGFMALTGFAKSQVLGKGPADLGIIADTAKHAELLRTVAEGRPVRGVEMTLKRRDGKPREALISMDAVTLAGERCFLAVLVDVTDQRQVERQLRQAQKMEAVGQLAAGIAHDFNNLLTVVHGYASMQLTRTDLDRDANKAFSQVRLASERAASLTRQLLAFGRKQVFQPKPTDLVATISQLVPILSRTLGEGIQLKFEPRPLPRVHADESSMEQVLMNFAVNARDAMSGQGVLSISTDVTVLRATDPGAPLTRPEGHFVLLTVADTGCGMSAETLAHIFEPFYTTKGLGRGTGLGLSTVYGIVKQHEGWIEVESAPGKGSIFRVYIPLAKDPDSAAADPRKSGTHDVVSLTPEEKILVVEDEAEVLEYIVTALETSGYPVEYARSGAEAVRKWKDPVSARLLITDMVMPEGLSGSALAQQMAARKPGLRVIYCSGYSPEVVAHGALLNEGVNFLAKPFTRDELLSAVFRALTDHRPCQLLPAQAPAEALEVAEAHAI